MKHLFSFFAIIFIAVSAGLLAHQDSGYVLFGRGHTTLEMSLSLFLVLLFLSYIFGYVLVRFVFRTWNMPNKLKQWRSTQQTKKARKTSLQGLINLSQGQWKKAERLLTRAVKNSDMPLLNYLSAAKAAQKQNAPERRDHYLSLAHKSMPDADFSVKLTQAELQFAHGQNEQALATLVHLHNLSPKHSHIMVLLSKLYQQLKSWDDLRKLLPQLRKHKVFSEKELLQIEKETYVELMQHTNWNEKTDKLQQLWQSISRELKKDTNLIEIYSNKLIQLNKNDEAELLLRNTIKKEWQPELVKQYGLVESTQLEKQLTFAESLSKDHDNNPLLLLTLGRLCMYNDLWGKARAYLEASIGNKELPETYKELGLLMEYLNEPKLAAEYFKKGLFLK
ncbi:MAG: heme biosynthesis HemY N-terminal domain-containing protein [Gammaproteobacteria bacterium]|nr:MAG: heme biosynthesis HemY N-terminal domain-containing protein [Gammaproteobacteria bacterium]